MAEDWVKWCLRYGISAIVAEKRSRPILHEHNSRLRRLYSHALMHSCIA